VILIADEETVQAGWTDAVGARALHHAQITAAAIDTFGGTDLQFAGVAEPVVVAVCLIRV
jgi:hypothetical protein